MSGNSNFDGDHASSSDCDDSHVGSGSTTISQKRKRGIVSMKKVTEARKRGDKIKIEFDPRGQPVGDNKATFVGYLGVVARNHIPLTENDWGDVPPELKQKVWEDIEQCFEVRETNRKVILKKLGKAAKDFRYALAKHCYDSEGNPIMTPPAEYAHIGVVRDSWEGFVEATGSERYQQMSQSNSSSAKNKKYLHRSGSKGYAQLRKEIAPLLEKEPPARHRLILYKELRRKPDGTFDEDVQRVVDEGERISATLNEEELLCRGPNDVLARIDEIKEYHGRVLTAGFGVTKGEYFGNRYDTSNEAQVYQLTQLVINMGSKIESMDSEIGNLKAQIHKPAVAVNDSCPSFHESPLGQSGHDSCPSHFSPAPEGESVCDIYVEKPYFVMVGSGSVLRIEGQRLHGRLLNDDQVKVRFIDIVTGCESIPLPYPNVDAEITLVSHALGTFVAWPLKLVSLQQQPEVPRRNVIKDKARSVGHSATPVKKTTYIREGCDHSPHECFLILKTIVDHDARDDSFSLPMPELFWGEAFEDHVSFEHVREVVKLQWLSASAICLYIRYLCDSYLVDEDVSTSFSFISPHHELERSHLVQMLLKHEDQDHLVMIPCNIGRSHWVLVAINMKKPENIYYMDPLRVHHGHEGRRDLVNKINAAITSYRGMKNKSSVRKKLTQQNNWVNVECPMQDPSSGLCGFYLCLFINDILESGNTNLSLAYFRKHHCVKFPDSRITSVQQGWCSYFYHKFIAEPSVC